MSLTRDQRIAARRRAVVAAKLAIAHAPSVHYTQTSPARWQGIHNHLLASKGEYPNFADCSSFVTWCLWNALMPHHCPDVVNGSNWQAGYTGTMSQHGMVIAKPEYAQPGDAVLYGAGIPFHTAMIIGFKNGSPVAASHGEESGPYVVPWNAWPHPVIRRYVLPNTPTG